MTNYALFAVLAVTLAIFPRFSTSPPASPSASPSILVTPTSKVLSVPSMSDEDLMRTFCGNMEWKRDRIRCFSKYRIQHYGPERVLCYQEVCISFR